MKKHLFLKSLLVLIGVLITSLTTNVRAYEFDYPVVYFDNQSGTDWSNTMFLYYYSYENGEKGSQGIALKQISNTKLWCQYLQHARGTNMDYFEYLFGDLYGSWDWNKHDNGSTGWNTRKSSFQSQTSGKYSGTANTNMYQKTFLATSTGTSNLTVTEKTSERQQIPPSSMKFNQTVNVVVNGNSSPSTSPAAISITSHYWTAWDAVSDAGSSTAITKGGSTITDAYNNAAYTAETSAEVTSIQDGYYFVGWYDAATGGSLVSDANPYTYYPREATTLYARFESKHTVNIYASMHGGAAGCTTSPSNGTAINNVGYYSTADISATAGNGCFFDQWSTTGGVTVGGTKTNPTTVKTAGSDGTVTAHFYTQWAIMGGHADSHTGSSDALGDWLDSYNDLVYVADNSFIGTITLPASTTLKFKVWDRENNHYWGCNTTITSSVNDYDFYNEGASDKNCTLTTGAAGDYTFAWNAADHKLSIIFPGDKAKSILKKNSIVYFDITTGNGTNTLWHNAAFTARFWFKTIAGKDITSVDKASGTMVENWHYYASVPDNDYVGRIHMNRINPSNSSEVWNTANGANKAIDRDNQYQNCLVYNHDAASPTLTWGTYCPPMSSATLSPVNNEDKTIVYAGAGTNENPYIVATSANIYVTASSTSALNDANMTPHYQFYQAGSAAQASPGAEDDYIYRITSSGTKQAMTVYAKNYYNGTYGTVSPVSNSIYYEARQPYNVSVAGLSQVTLASGRTGLTGAVEGVNYVATFTADEGYNLPASAEGGKIVVLRSSSDIAANCTWSVSAGVGTLTVPAAYVTADLAISVYGVLKTYDITYNGGTYGSGSLTGGTKNHFTDYTLSDNSTAFTRDGYTYDGWSINAGGSTKDYNLGGTYSTEADQTFYPHWIPAYSVTHTLSHINCTSGATGSIAGVSGRNYVATFTAPAGYALPETVGVTIGGVSKTQGTHFTWSISDGVGTLTVLSVNVTAAIVVTITGTPVTLRFTSGSDWHTASNWTPACVPTIEHEVIIPKNCWISQPTAQAKSVTIEHYGDKDGKLYISQYSALNTGALLVAEGISSIHEEGGDSEPTTKDELQIGTDYDGNGGLICGNRSTNTQATYIFYSKVYRYGSYYINQYVGIPFAEMDPYDWYGVNIFKYNATKDSWMTPESGNLQPWTAYNIISKYSGATWTTFYTDGTLNLPGTNNDKPAGEGAVEYRKQVLTCGSRYSTTGVFDDKEHNGDYMFANSWTAPISVAAMNEYDVDGLLKEIHIFNAGFVGDTIKPAGDNPGQWTCITFGAASYIADSVIPATQAFCVTATKANATLTLDYKKHVYDPAKNAGRISTYPTRAPRRNNEIGDPNILRIKVMHDSIMSDNMYVFERGDFTNEYDNGWDGTKMFGRSTAPQIYGVQGEGKTSIHAIPDMHGALLGFKAGTDTNAYSFSFEYNDGEPLYLYDRDTQEFTEITNDATYSFTTNDTEEHQRFIISRVNSPSILTSLEEIANESVKHAEKYFENNMLFIRRGDKVYSVDGRLVK